MAEKVWERSRWGRVMNKMAQDIGETMRAVEIQGLKVFFLDSFFFFFFF